MLISAAAGGTATLGMSSATFSSGSLIQDSVVQLAQIPVNTETPPGKNQPFGPVLRAAFFSASSSSLAKRRSNAIPSSVNATFTFPVTGDAATGLARFLRHNRRNDVDPGSPDLTLPLMRIYGNANPTSYVDVAPTFTLDPKIGLVTVVLTGNLASFAQNTVVELFLVKISGADPACGLQGHFNAGLRYYDPTLKAWSSKPPTEEQQPTHTLLLLHGIMSCVEGTFNPGLVERYRADGEYDQIIGYDYDWLATPDEIAPQIATAVNTLDLSKLDIYAHSYGTINALAVTPLLNVPRVDNLVLYAGPLDGSYLDSLPIYQSLIADGSFTPVTAFGSEVTASALEEATKIFQPGNDQLKQIETAFIQSKKAVRVVKIAGNSSVLNGHDLGALYTQITGLPQPQSDGIVSTASAESGAVYGQQPAATADEIDVINQLTDAKDFPFNHTALVSDQGAQLTTENFMAPDLAFSIPNVPGGSGLYPDSGAQLVLKGIGSRAHFYPINAFGATQESVQNFSSSLLTVAPMSIPVVYGSSSTPLTFTVVQSPANAPSIVNGMVFPSASAVFDFTETNPPDKYLSADFYLLPSCVSCAGTAGSTPAQMIRQHSTQRIGRQSGPSMSTGPSVKR